MSRLRRLAYTAPVSRPPESLANPRLWLAFATMLLVSGFANSYVLFLPPLLAEYHAPRATIASPLSVIWFVAAALGPVAGWLVSRSNPRLVVMTGLGAAAVGILLGAHAPSLGVMIASVGIAVGVGLGLTGLSTQAALLADSYRRRRGVAMGIAFSGAMAAFMLGPLTQRLIGSLGWRGAFVCHAVLMLALVPVAWYVLPVRLGGHATLSGSAAGAALPSSLGQIVRSLPFWALLVVFTTPPLFGNLATTQHALYFPARGFSAAETSLMLAAGGVLAASGRVLAGLAADRFGAAVAGLASFSVSTAGVLCLLGMETWPSRVFAYGYVLFLFLPLGSRATIVSVLLGRIAGPRNYGPIFGLLGIGNSLGSAAGPWLSGAIFDRTHSYLALYLATFAFALTGIAALVVFLLTARQSS